MDFPFIPTPPRDRKTGHLNVDAGASKFVIIIIAMLGLNFCLHKLFLGKFFQFALAVLFSWTFIPSVISFIDIIILIFTPSSVFEDWYPDRII